MGTEPNDPADLVTVQICSSPHHAQVLAALLRAEGIRVHVGGEALQDEFAVSRRLIGALSVEVQVRRDELEQAREVMAAAREVDETELEAEAMAAEHLETPPAEDAKNRTFGLAGPAAVGFAVLSGVLTVLLMQRPPVGEDPLYDVTYDGERACYFWRGTRTLAFESFDRDRDGTAEVSSAFDRQGRLAAVAHDENQNGIRELAMQFSPSGEKCVWTDADEDAFDELLIVFDQQSKELQRFTFVAGRGFVASDR